MVMTNMAELTAKTTIYIARDLERALGPQNACPSFFIITNSTPFAKEMAKNNPNIVTIPSLELLDTPELLVHPATKEFIAKHPNPHLVVFKNLRIIEKICAEHGWKLLNPSATLSQQIEEKISQVEWLGELKKFLPPHHIDILSQVKFSGEPFILQFNRAHTGGGTFLIKDQSTLTALATKFPNRPVRATSYIKGNMLTSNNIVTNTDVIVGNINYQITGLTPFAKLLFATIGNDWALPKKLLSPEQTEKYHDMVTAIGEKLRASGWRGLFGVDVILADTGELYLIEINARQPASTTYESVLQEKARVNDQEYTTFSAHLAALAHEPIDPKSYITIADGAQIILRQTEPNISAEKINTLATELTAAGFHCIAYANRELGADLLRIQSPHGLMAAPNTFNDAGGRIVSLTEPIL